MTALDDFVKLIQQIQPSPYNPIRMAADMAEQEVRKLREDNANLERELSTKADASSQALTDICKLLKAPDWEYPGQVVRDVALALNISLEEMAEILKKG